MGENSVLLTITRNFDKEGEVVPPDISRLLREFVSPLLKIDNPSVFSYGGNKGRRYTLALKGDPPINLIEVAELPAEIREKDGTKDALFRYSVKATKFFFNYCLKRSIDR